MVHVALDEQIFAIQPYGGISRLFYEKASAFVRDPTLGIQLEPLSAPVVNEYLLGDPELALVLQATRSRNPYAALASNFTRRRRNNNVDLVHNTFYLPRGLEDHKAARRVVTIYDMIPELLPKTRRRMDFITEKHKYVQNADHIICISESTRNDLLRFYPEIHSPITIAYPGVGAAFTTDPQPASSLPENYVLHVGNRSSYKDGETLFRAFASIAGDFPQVTLFLVGGGPLSKQERDLCNSLGILQRIEQRSLPEEGVAAAYAHALITVFPSRYEGFGLPAVEALACGSPLVLADTSSLPEVGGAAARYFPPGDIPTLAQLIGSLLSNDTVRCEFREAGIEQSKKFTWHGYAESNAIAYQNVLSQ